MSYAGVVRGPIVLCLSKEVAFTLPTLRLINHPFHLFLLGSDVVKGGRGESALNFVGMDLATPKEGMVGGALKFSRGGVTYQCKFDHVPADGMNFKHAQSTHYALNEEGINAAGALPLGGQHV